MDRQLTYHNHQINTIHTGLLLVAMAGLLCTLGWLVAGITGAKTAMIAGVLVFVFTPKLPSTFVMRHINAKPLDPVRSPMLYSAVAQLARRAGLRQVPRLYYLPTHELNAFAVGNESDAAIGITQGLISSLSARQMAGILAHEITHIKNNDYQVMALSAIFGRFSHTLSLVGQMLLILSLPLVMTGYVTISLFPLAILIFAPFVSVLIHQALSRTREFEADLGSAALLDDPRALASALATVEQANSFTQRRLFLPVPARPGQANLLNSHPPTKQRIERLMALMPPKYFASRPEIPRSLLSI